MPMTQPVGTSPLQPAGDTPCLVGGRAGLDGYGSKTSEVQAGLDGVVQGRAALSDNSGIRCDNSVVAGFSGLLQTVSFADVGVFAFWCQFCAGFFGVSLEQLRDFFAAVHVLLLAVKAVEWLLR